MAICGSVAVALVLTNFKYSTWARNRPGATHPRSTCRAQQGRQTAFTLCDERGSEQNVAQHGQQEPAGDAPLHYCRRRIASCGTIVVRKAAPVLFENRSVKLGALGACCIR